MTEVLTTLITVGLGGFFAVWLEIIRRKMNKTDEKTTQVVAELNPNAGTSTKDQLTRIELSVVKFGEIQAQQGERIAYIEGRLDDHMQQTREGH